MDVKYKLKDLQTFNTDFFFYPTPPGFQYFFLYILNSDGRQPTCSTMTVKIPPFWL